MSLHVTREDIDRFVEHCRKKVPNFSMRDGKRDSYLMNVIDGIVWPFNRRFMDRYITTIIGKVFFPDGTMYRRPLATLEIGSHEFKHAYDVKRLTAPLFVFLYLSPQLLALATLAVYGSLVSWVGFLPFAALATHLAVTAFTFKVRKWTGCPLLLVSMGVALFMSIDFVGSGAWWLLAAFVPVLPIPSPGRAWVEYGGYGMSIHFEIWVDGEANVTSKVRQFITFLYYLMWPFGDAVLKRLRRYEERARAGDVTDPAYLHIKEFIDELKLRQQGGSRVA